VIERNNWNRHSSPEIGGIKVHYFIDGLVEGNLVRDNDGYGIWLDNVYRNARVSRNLVIGNRGSAIFVELGQGPVLIDNNVLANTRPSLNTQDPRADGLYTFDASGVNFVHNLVFGCQGFGSFHRKMTDRTRVGVSNIVLQNNIFIDNRAGHINLPYPGPSAQDNHTDHNLFSAGGEYLVNPWGGTSAEKLISAVEKSTRSRPKLWNKTSPRMSLKEWQKLNSWGSESIEAKSAKANISQNLVITLELGRAVHQLKTTPVKQSRRDFFGAPLPQQNALAGPFQRLSDGRNSLPLWPPARR
jgi:parallel beta-helix repeat protein